MPTSDDRQLTAVVITVSTAGAKGRREDKSGPALRDGLTQLGLSVSAVDLIPDDRLAIQKAVLQHSDHVPVSLLAFTGGTGATADDVTPESLLPLLDRRFEGFEAALHATGRAATPRAPLSRLLVGSRHRTLILALPGAPNAITEALGTLEPILVHLLKLMAGRPDPH